MLKFSRANFREIERVTDETEETKSETARSGQSLSFAERSHSHKGLITTPESDITLKAKESEQMRVKVCALAKKNNLEGVKKSDPSQRFRRYSGE